MNLFLRIVFVGLLAQFASSGGAAELRPWDGTQPAPFALKDLSGREHRLADYRGRVVVINFWATWCEPCRDEMPALEKLKERFAGRPFTVLAVNVDEPEARIRKFLSVLPLTFPVLLDYERKLAKSWNVRLLPATYVVGPDGGVRFSAFGEVDWSAREVGDRIARLFPAR
jgi:thiol-disulfide isomerase/thioredoxin